MVAAAYTDPKLRELSTSPGHEVEVGNRTLQYNNTNRLVKSPSWDIGLQKTGYISEAGQCLVMQAKVAGRKLIMVFLDSTGKFSRLADAERVRRWIESNPATVAEVPSGSAVESYAGGLPLYPRAYEISLAVAWSLLSQPSSSRSAGAEIESPATSLPWSS